MRIIRIPLAVLINSHIDNTFHILVETIRVISSPSLQFKLLTVMNKTELFSLAVGTTQVKTYFLGKVGPVISEMWKTRRKFLNQAEEMESSVTGRYCEICHKLTNIQV